MNSTWGDWGSWQCGADCGNITEFRNRSCENAGTTTPYDCPLDCDGNGKTEDSDEVECDAGCCEGET